MIYKKNDLQRFEFLNNNLDNDRIIFEMNVLTLLSLIFNLRK